jgi:hypothetical protein
MAGPMRMLPKEMNTTSAPLDLGGSNHLIDLAARIKAEHETVSVALKDSVHHAIEGVAFCWRLRKSLNTANGCRGFAITAS